MDHLRLLENESGGSCVERALEENTLDDMSVVDWSTRGIPDKILNRIFRLLDQESLRQTRLVCTVWNNVALGILSKTPGTVEFRFKKDADGNVNEVGRIQKLHSILQWTNYPEMFFTELTIGDWCSIRDVVFLQRQPQLIHLLQKFGSTLKSLELNKVTLHSSILRPLLQTWCANLQELTCSGITVIEDNVTVQSLEMSPNPLKLNLRESTFFLTGVKGAAQDMIALIMKLSPKLRSLYVWDLGKSDFWRKINLHPSVTENLEEATFRTREELTDLSLISDISFSKKLKCLVLLIEKPTFPKEQLVRFLQTVPESLERLCLHLEDCENDYKIEFPLMKNLKVMEHSHGGELCYDSMDVLEKFPNLQILRMAFFFGFMNPEFPDSLFSKSLYLSTHPHTNLNTLSIDYPFKNAATIFSINRMLPNLQELTLELCILEISEPAQESWLITIFIGLSEMKKLSNLNLFFRPSFEFNGSQTIV